MSITQPSEFLIITGANMAGKSTFLRTVGVNLVLATCGAPVCASQFSFVPIPLITSVRVTDSLDDNESYFFAELKRLKRIIDQLKSEGTTFIIVDEMLRGTNSKDKQTGSRKFIEQLIRLKGVGLVATHDLSLGTLADEYPNQAFNKRFEVEIADDSLHFDYKLKEGISQNLNATFLMEKMGIMA
jgi:DNA mismatch repair ATPase MutS